jgi:hypothetical protein
LDERDFLTEFPVFDSFKFGEIDPPAWALQAIKKRGGHRPRGGKREVIHGSHIVPFSPARPSWDSGGYSPLPAHYRPKTADEQAIFDKAIAKSRRKGQLQKSQQQVSQKSLVPKGNLINDDYRYWKGFSLNYSALNEGTCRWCQVLFRGRDKMLEHHNKSSCKLHLTALYRYAKLSSKTQRYCFACKQETSNAHWGIPMCDDSNCYSRWKFNFNVQLQGFQQYRQWALKAQLQAGSKGPFGELPPQDELDEEATWGTPC